MKDKRKAYEEKFDAQLKEWSDELDLPNAKADKTRIEMNIEYYKIFEALRASNRWPGRGYRN